MHRKRLPGVARLAVILGLVALPSCLLWAQNENETVGFQSNHIFESGHFGEDIDILNGGLNLTVPVGPSYQVNDRLSYQLNLHYSSKIWETSDYSGSNANSIQLVNERPLGAGFNLSFGRLVQDFHNIPSAGYEYTWKWETPDGNQHVIWIRDPATSTATAPDGNLLKTGDGSYIHVEHTPFNANPPIAEKFTISTPDGLTYTLTQHVYYPDATDANVRAQNESFGGWYVTQIEDRSIGGPTVTNNFGTTPPVSGLYPNHVVIAYDTRSNFEHVIKEIRDSRGRVITFHNCRYTNATTCVDDTGGPPARSQVATYEIDLPGFSVANANAGSESIDMSPAAMAVYKFTYRYGTMNRFFPEPGGLTVPPAGPTLQLMRMDYPEYVHRDGTHETYSLYFGYGLTGELECRTLPLPKDESKSCADWSQGTSLTGARAIFEYFYDHYRYLPVYLAPGSAHIGAVVDGTPAQAVVRKTILEPTPSNPSTWTWSYQRYLTQGTTNPNQVTVTDPLGNDTVYYYRASYHPSDQDPHDNLGHWPDDGIAPEWDDGLNYRIEYYRGLKVGGTLIRTENREYETDSTSFSGDIRQSKDNSRVRRTVKVFNDAGGAEAVVSNSGWDNYGHHRMVSETGFGVQGVRNSHTDYFAMDPTNTSPADLVYLTGLQRYHEIHDGFRVLERTDDFYDSRGRLTTSIARRTLPVTLGTPVLTSFQKGDIKTTYTYDATDGRLKSKYIASGGDGAPSDYCIYYTWTPDMHLKSKTFGKLGTDGQCDPTSLLSWKAIDRMRDGNTGLIFEVRDPAYVPGSSEIKTDYRYDRLGRVTDITPTAPEFPTIVDYVSLKETTVTRNPASTTDFAFQRYRYDDFGRLVCEEKRPAAGSYPYRTKRYDAMSRIVFESEWLLGGTSCDPGASGGTTSDYGTPPDPFGRVQMTTTADGKVTTTSYLGEDSTVTVEGVVGVDGVSGPVTTRFYRDAFNRLIRVVPSANGGPTADYTYDFRDNVVQVDLRNQANPLNKQTRFFEYDGLNRLFQAINPESNTTVYTDYDGLGKVRSVTDANGTTLLNTYDPAGRLKSVQLSGLTTLLVENAYDTGDHAAGKISSSISRDEGGATVSARAFAYGGLNGRLSSLSQSFGGVSPSFPVSYNYDNYGNVATLTYPEGPAGQGGALSAAYSYSNGIPISVQEQSTLLTLGAVTYNPAGGIQTVTTPNSMTTTISPDTRNRPKILTIGQGTYNDVTDTYSGRTDYQSGTFNYDGAGNIYEMDRLNGLKNLYHYDSANRLIEAYDQVGTGTSGYTQYTQCFRYDDYGNILGKKDQTTPNTCSHIAGEDLVFLLTPPSGANTNRILNEQRTGTTPAVVNFFYDTDGNLLKDWERRYQYDSRNRMLSVSRISDATDMSSPSTELAVYGYDSDGNRVTKDDRSRELKTYYVRGPDGNVLSEFRRTEVGVYQPEWLQHHVYLAGREVAMRENQVPNPVAGLGRNPGAQQTGTAKLKFRKNPVEDNVTSYNLYRDSGSGMTVIAHPSASCSDPNFICYTDTGLTPGTAVAYQVSAVSTKGEGYLSDILDLIVGDSTKPFAPTCITGTAGNGKITLTWQSSVSDDVLGYNVYRRAGTTGSILKITQLLVGQTTYVDSGLTNDQIYYYWVRAVDNSANESLDVVNGGKTCGPTGVSCSTTADCTCIGCDYLCNNICGSSSNTTFSAMPKDYAPPGPPRGVSVAGDCAAQGTAQVTWDANADTDGVQTYWVYRTPDFSPPGPRSSGVDAQGFPSTIFNDSGLTSPNTYLYYVKGEDSKGNRSLASLQAGVKPRANPGILPPPPNQLNIVAGDGEVRVRFEKPAVAVNSVVIYRKPNAEPSCTAFQEVHEINQSEWPANPYLDYLDGTVENGMAWDYAIASRDSGGTESALSKLGLAIPVATPRNVRQCVDTSLPSIECNKHTAIRWDQPPGKPYQPLTATNAAGTLGYLMGYHVTRYYSLLNGNTDSSILMETPLNPHPWSGDDVFKRHHCSTTGSACADDDGYCAEGFSTVTWQACVSMGRCMLDWQPSCDPGHGDLDCAAGTHCSGSCSLTPSLSCTTSADCGSQGGTCGGLCTITDDDQPCVQKADCPAPASCHRYDNGVQVGSAELATLPTDPYLLENPSLEVSYPLAVHMALAKQCVSVSSVYKVYANGDWQTVVSGPTNFDRTQTGVDNSNLIARCVGMIDPCSTDTTALPPQCSNEVAPPSFADGHAPTVSSPARGQVKVSWDDLSGEPDVAGYYLYVREENDASLVVTVKAHPFSVLKRMPYVVVGSHPSCFENGKPCYLLTGLPINGRIGTVARYQFQVAAFDLAGRTGRASDLSQEISWTGQAASDPIGLKTVVWTENDANKDGPPGYGIANPRSFDGIKLEWTGNGYQTQWAVSPNRVYRSESPDGPFCVLLKLGAGNPTDQLICADSTAWSTTQTTESTPSNGMSSTDSRFFIDKNVVPGRVYYYKVTHFDGSSEGTFSDVVQGMALKHPAQPLSPPRHLKAWAPVTQQADGSWKAGPGVFLRWCPNRADEGVTAYRIYRKTTPGGPYSSTDRIAQIDNPTDPGTIAANCLMGSQRCEISSTACGACTAPPCVCKSAACTTGPGGTCKIVDLDNISYPYKDAVPSSQTQKYYYVVTAVRGNDESGYSNENVALPNYFCDTCNPPSYIRRFDPDNEGDIACDDEMSSIQVPIDELDSLAGVMDEDPTFGAPGREAPASENNSLAPYRLIGARRGSGGGTTHASSRWLFYHTDHLGSPRVIADVSGNIVSQHHYMPFGEEKPIPSRVSTNAKMFTDHERDIESASSDNPDGLDYMMARYYSSSLGRFMAVDPIQKIEKSLENPQRWNRYTYSLNNPIKFFDPDGKDAKVAIDRQNNVVHVKINVVMSGPAASPEVAKKFESQANATWGGGKGFTAKDGTKMQLDVKVEATTDPSKFSKGDAPNKVTVNDSGDTGMKGDKGTLNANDLDRPGVAGHEAGHLMGVLDSPDPEGNGVMNPNGQNAKPTQEELDQAGQVALEQKKKKPQP